MKKVHRQKLHREFLAFCVIGTVGFGIDVTTLYATAPELGWYQARAVSFTVAAFATWWLNRNFTFKKEESLQQPPLLYQYLRYLALMLGGALINYLLYVAVLRWLAVPGAPVLGVALGSCGGLVINFIVARHLVFK